MDPVETTTTPGAHHGPSSSTDNSTTPRPATPGHDSTTRGNNNGPASDDSSTTRPTGSGNGPASDDSSGPRPTGQHQPQPQPAADRSTVKDGKQKNTGKKTLWVTVFRCFHCGKHGHNLPKCRQCAQAYYCNADCQRKHWRKHKPVCRAAVAALAQRATRERLARAVREKGKDKVAGAEEDDLCVICLSKPVDPVEVSV